MNAPESMLDLWKSSRKSGTTLEDGDIKQKTILALENDLSEWLGDLPYRLTSNVDVQEILHLKGDDAQKAIDFLDKVSSRTKFEDLLHRDCETTLRRLCGRTSLLPKSITLSESDINRTSTAPSCGGGFADVYEGVYLGKLVALKALRVYGKDNIRKVQKSFCKEAVFWRQLTHPNIVSFLGVVNSETLALCMVSTWMRNGNLAKFLKANPHASRLELLLDAANGLLYLHRQGMVHGDIKSANVLVDDKLHACLSDFGLAAVTHDARTASMITTSSTAHGSIRWMAPELLHPMHTGREHGRATAESDTYAFAMLMLEAFTGRIPFEHQHRDATVVIDVTLGIRPPRPGPEAASRGLSDALWSLMEECWQADWKRRPRVPSLLVKLEEANKTFIPQTLPSISDLSTESKLRITSQDDSDPDNDSDDGRFLCRDLLYGSNIEVSPNIHIQQESDGTTDLHSPMESPSYINAGPDSLVVPSGSYSVEPSSQGISSFNDEDWDMDSSAAF
ncbi:kinase-like protein [Schizopora paradoxa]|uniref:Kinase-like protein n=1 Tax=Schizopora paradoxa TaxID=27342 RepID=A0A0H2RPV1_9AGAM|nr:kinase-like protein [Schizopora paradoxa]